MTSEAAFAAAVQRDPLLLEDASRQRVVIATPATMLALLQVVQLGRREHALSANAEKVRRLATELVGRLGVLTGHLSKVGKALEQAANAHNQAVGSRRPPGQLLSLLRPSPSYRTTVTPMRRNYATLNR